MSNAKAIDGHAARALLILDATNGLDSLSKLSQIDFLVRYPAALAFVAEGLSIEVHDQDRPSLEETLAVETHVLRFKNGPWADRYIPIIGALTGRRLASIDPASTPLLRITPLGRECAEELRSGPEWSILSSRCRVAAKVAPLSDHEIKRVIEVAITALESVYPNDYLLGATPWR